MQDSSWRSISFIICEIEKIASCGMFCESEHVLAIEFGLKRKIMHVVEQMDYETKMSNKVHSFLKLFCKRMYFTKYVRNLI